MNISFPKLRRMALILPLALISLLISPYSANAAPYLKVGNYVQMVDWLNGTSYNSTVPDLYSSTGPIYNDTGLTLFGGAFAQAKGNADYGSLGFYAYSDRTFTTSAYAGGGSTFSDMWTISNPVLNGTSGQLNVWVDVGGLILGTIGHPGVYGGQGWNVRFADNSYSDTGSWDWANNTGRQTYHGYLNQMVNFVYGQPFEFRLQFSAWASDPFQLTGIADYYNTMTLDMNKSQLFDSQGNPITNYSLAAESGHNYFGAPTPTPAIPEPATVLLLGAGLAGLLLLRRKVAA